MFCGRKRCGERLWFSCSPTIITITASYLFQSLALTDTLNGLLFLDFQVRLTGSNLPFAGTIEVSYYGVWGGILSYGMDIRVGHVACRQLGYSGAQQVFPHGFFGKGKDPLLMSRMTCNGNESDLSQCTSETINTHWSWYWHYYYYWTRNAGAVLCANANVSISKGGYSTDVYDEDNESEPNINYNYSCS